METKLADIVNQTLNQESNDKKQELSETFFFVQQFQVIYLFVLKNIK